MAEEGTKQTPHAHRTAKKPKAASQQIPHDQAYPGGRREDYKPPDRQEAKPPSEGKKKLKFFYR